VKWESRETSDKVQLAAIAFMLIMPLGVWLWVKFTLPNSKPAQKYTEREHWVMEEVLSKIKPECLK